MKKAELKQRVNELETELQKTVSALETKTTENMNWFKRYQESEKTIEEMHQMFDGLENCPREAEDGRDYCSGKVKLSLSARFARYLQTLVYRGQQ